MSHSRARSTWRIQKDFLEEEVGSPITQAMIQAFIRLGRKEKVPYKPDPTNPRLVNVVFERWRKHSELVGIKNLNYVLTARGMDLFQRLQHHVENYDKNKILRRDRESFYTSLSNESDD